MNKKRSTADDADEQKAQINFTHCRLHHGSRQKMHPPTLIKIFFILLLELFFSVTADKGANLWTGFFFFFFALQEIPKKK